MVKSGKSLHELKAGMKKYPQRMINVPVSGKVVRPERFELPTFWFVARRSIQLSYGRAVMCQFDCGSYNFV